jgi:hypothetical protein
MAIDTLRRKSGVGARSCAPEHGPQRVSVASLAHRACDVAKGLAVGDRRPPPWPGTGSCLPSPRRGHAARAANAVSVGPPRRQRGPGAAALRVSVRSPRGRHPLVRSASCGRADGYFRGGGMERPARCAGPESAADDGQADCGTGTHRHVNVRSRLSVAVSSWTVEQQWREREEVLTPRVPNVPVDRTDAGSRHVGVLDPVLVEER